MVFSDPVNVRRSQSNLQYSPPERHNRTPEEPQNARERSCAECDNDSVHYCTQQQLLDLDKSRPFQNITDGVEILVLRIFDKPHCTGTHNTAAACEEDSELIPAKDAIISYHEVYKGSKQGITDMNMVPMTQ